MRGKRAKEIRRYLNEKEPFSFSHFEGKSLKPPYRYEEIGKTPSGRPILQRTNRRLRRYQELKRVWTALPVPRKEALAG